MPELPEVEVLVRHLDPVLEHQRIRAVEVRRPKVIAPCSSRQFARALIGARFETVTRRGKFLVFTLRAPGPRRSFTVLGHLGMTGRMYLLPRNQSLPKHAAVVLSLGPRNFVYEDPRYFGRLTLNADPLNRLGPEPLGDQFTVQALTASLARSSQPIKIKLLDQSLVAGIGNIYASETLFRARISPLIPARKLSPAQVGRLWRAIRAVLREAIRFGSTVPLDWSRHGRSDRLFYYGLAAGVIDYYEERLRVYDRAGLPCVSCGTAIRQRVQGARSTYYCPVCQTRR